jgi:hypothetical protein
MQPPAAAWFLVEKHNEIYLNNQLQQVIYMCPLFVEDSKSETNTNLVFVMIIYR